MNHNVIEEFINDYCPDIDSFSELFKEIYNISIKNFGRKMIQKLCQFIAFVYIKVMHWRNTRISAQVLQIEGYRKQIFFPLLAHNLLGFSFFFVVFWKTKNFCIGGSNLTNVSYAQIGDQVKFFVPVKYYQQSPANSADTITPKENLKVKYACEKFLKSVWFGLISMTRKKIDYSNISPQVKA